MQTFTTVADLEAAVGDHLGYSDWLSIDQDRIDTFADATGDHQWIHVDPERAAGGPFGGTIAHGYLTLSLVPVLVVLGARLRRLDDQDQLRLRQGPLPAPVPVGSRVRAGVELLAVRAVPAGIQVINRVTVEIEGSDRPAARRRDPHPPRRIGGQTLRVGVSDPPSGPFRRSGRG